MAPNRSSASTAQDIGPRTLADGHEARQSGRMLTRAAAVLIAVVALLAAAPAAFGAVTVSRAEVSSGTLRLEGRALANRSITVDGVAMTTSDGSGSFRVQRSSYRPPADCTVDVN